MEVSRRETELSFQQLLDSHSCLDSCLILQITTRSFWWHEGAYSRSCSQFFHHAALIFSLFASVCVCVSVSLFSLSGVCVQTCGEARVSCAISLCFIPLRQGLSPNLEGGWWLASLSDPPFSAPYSAEVWGTHTSVPRCRDSDSHPQACATSCLTYWALFLTPSCRSSYSVGTHYLFTFLDHCQLFVCTSWNTVPSKDIIQSSVVPEYPDSLTCNHPLLDTRQHEGKLSCAVCRLDAQPYNTGLFRSD